MSAAERFDSVVIGGGQAGLSMGYQLQRLGHRFVILEANERVGDSWRKRWDSLRLFTPGIYDSLSGMRFTGPMTSPPTKDEFADYLLAYSEHLGLPLMTGVRVSRISREGDRLVVEAAGSRFEAANVIVAAGAFQNPRTPDFAAQLDPRIHQMHSVDYRNPSQLRPGSVLLVGAGNSGADISLEVVREHQTYLAGRHPGHVPFRIEGKLTRHLVHVVRFLGHHVLNLGTPVGRKVLPKLMGKGDPLVRVKPRDILAAGVERVPKVSGVFAGLPLLEDGRTLDVDNVIWCTGFRPDFSWIDLPAFDLEGHPLHERGVVPGTPGLYFLGLEFQYGVTSDIICGVGRDAEYLARHIGTTAPAASATARQAMRA
ncbi:NAD(P)/FAD-dependent oxidoreductase [soil metagenome]